jgi:DNA-binding beta-propeller fold protein YncE
MQRARRTWAVAFVTVLASLIVASTASAGNSIYWVNFEANKVSHANAGGGAGNGVDIPISGGAVDVPHGLAIDAAAGKLYWANYAGNSIGFANLNGSGGGLLNTSGIAVDRPSGLAIDPIGSRIYWGNTGTNTIGFANLNGTGGGTLNTTGATVNGPFGLTVQPDAGRVYWTNKAAGGSIALARLNGSGGNDLDTAGAIVDGPEGIAVDAAASRVYWTNANGNSIGYANLDGGGGGLLDTGGTVVDGPAGLAIDPPSGFLYWANAGNDTIGYMSLKGSPSGQMDTTGATTKGVAFPVLLQQPRNIDLPTVQGRHRPGETLTCSPGRWVADQPQSFLYLAPQFLSYQWYRNGEPTAAATAPTILARKVGAYSCAVTGTNFAGSADALSGIDFPVNATVAFKSTRFNRRKGTAAVRVSVTGSGRLDAYGNGVANVTRKHVQGTVKLIVHSSGRARIKLNSTGKARVKATIAYTPEGGKAIKRRKTIALKKKLKR